MPHQGRLFGCTMSISPSNKWLLLMPPGFPSVYESVTTLSELDYGPWLINYPSFSHEVFAFVPDFNLFITWSDIHIGGGLLPVWCSQALVTQVFAFTEPRLCLESSNAHIWLHMCSVTRRHLSSFPQGRSAAAQGRPGASPSPCCQCAGWKLNPAWRLCCLCDVTATAHRLRKCACGISIRNPLWI